MEEKEEIDLRQIFKDFWKRKWIVVAVTILSTVIGFVYTMQFVKPVYTATTTLVLASKDNSLNSNLVATYRELLKSNNILEEVVKNLKQNNIYISEESIKNNISVASTTGTQILQVTCKNENPEYAKMIADETSRVFINSIKALYKIENLTIYAEAEIPLSPSNINHRNDILKFMIGGFALSIVCIFALNLFDTTIKTKEELENEFNLHVLSTIPVYETQMQKIDSKRIKKKTGGNK